MDNPQAQMPPRPQVLDSDVITLSSDDEDVTGDIMNNDPGMDRARQAQQMRLEAARAAQLNQVWSGSAPIRQAPIAPRAPAPATLAPGRSKIAIFDLPRNITVATTSTAPVIATVAPAPSLMEAASREVNKNISVAEFLRVNNHNNSRRLPNLPALSSTSVPSVCQGSPRHQTRQNSAPPAEISAPKCAPPRQTSAPPVPSPYPGSSKIEMTANKVPILYPIIERAKSSEEGPSTSSNNVSAVDQNPSRSKTPPPREDQHSPMLLALLKDGPKTKNAPESSPIPEESSELTQDFSDIQVNGSGAPRTPEVALGPTEFENPGETDSRASSLTPVDAPMEHNAPSEPSDSPPPQLEAEEPMEMDQEDTGAPDVAPEDVAAIHNIFYDPEDVHQQCRDALRVQLDNLEGSDVQSSPEAAVGAPRARSEGEALESPERSENSGVTTPKSEPEAPKRSHKKKPEKMRSSVEPTRKSTRIQGMVDAEKKDEEVPVNFKKNEDGAIQDRGTHPPIGLTRKPFRFKHAEEKADRLKNQLHINMEPVFGQIASSQPGTSVGAVSTRSTKRAGSPERTSILAGNRRRGALQPPGKEVQARVGGQYQLDPKSMPYLNGAPDPDEDREREEALFIPLEFNEDKEVITRVEKEWKHSPDLFYDSILTIYWRAIWRQFEGQIDFDTALKHLMDCEYQILKALDTIDQNLPNLTQEMKPICMVQALELEKAVKSDKWEKISLRQMQEKGMRNYHLGEIHTYQYHFNRYFIWQEKEGVGCNCTSPLCIDIKFEPRLGCARCNRRLRKYNAADRDKRCLICITYKRLNNGRERPAENVVFNDREKKFILGWNHREQVQRRKLSREEVEAQISAENTLRWKRQSLTEEEWDMVDEKGLKITNRDTKGKLTQSEQKIRGEKIAAQLQPFVLPLFTKCQCRMNGGVARGTANRDKWEWSGEEQIKYRDLLILHDGDQFLTSEALGVEAQLVERFVMVHSSTHEIWKGYRIPRLHRRFKAPALNLPPIISLGDSSNNSRDGSPYIPPEEMRAAKKMRRS